MAQGLGASLPQPKLLSSWTDEPWKCQICLDLYESERQETDLPVQGL